MAGRAVNGCVWEVSAPLACRCRHGWTSLGDRRRRQTGPPDLGKPKRASSVPPGAPPQHETWDPETRRPTQFSGDLKPIATATPGFLVGELMPKTARLTNKIAVLRAVQTNDNAHSSKRLLHDHGHPHKPVGVENAKPGAPNDWPCLGSRGQTPSGKGRVRCRRPSHCRSKAANDGNRTWPGQDAGFLGRSSDPWLLQCEPEADGFQIPGLSLSADISARPVRAAALRSAAGQRPPRCGSVERRTRLSRTPELSRPSILLSSPQARQAFDLNREPAKVRDRYGR